MSSVTAHLSTMSLPTYPVGAPEKNPVFFEKRVYQGSNGKVYPVPFIDKVFDEPRAVDYRSAVLENEHVRLVMLPEIGGRILLGQDKDNRDYDFFYRQDVIKPALVGLAGPWISGGVEFNWPQHHRPGTFMPADVSIEEEADGARTVWFSEHDPLNRLKGMHGLRLRPDSSLIELRARLYNRTPFTQSFLWWANVAARVHDQYQSFFPPDVHYVADHAVRAMSSFPCAENLYYGVNYKERPGCNDLTWYRNIPVPTSYMICQTGFDFFGGYDHGAAGGFLHVADRHIAPGKKQWTWGNHEFGWAWDRELTDANGPYIELMAGVFTDNQPDFSYLHPYETKTFSQYWWPIQQVGPVQNASKDAALRLIVSEKRQIEAAVLVSSPLKGARILLTESGRIVHRERVDLRPGKPHRLPARQLQGDSEEALCLQLVDARGREVLSYRPQAASTERNRSVATEPAQPERISTSEALYLTGEHLEQYRHPTRDPESYWNELLKRDPLDSRAHLALARRLLRRAQPAEALPHLEAAITRLCHRHPNPETGEAHYLLGLGLRQLALNSDHPLLSEATLLLLDRAESAFAKATWNYAWRNAAGYQAACLRSLRGDRAGALEKLAECQRCNQDHNQAQVLSAALLRLSGKRAQARKLLTSLLKTDPLDHWATFEMALLSGDFTNFLTQSRNDAQTVLDLCLDYVDAGLFEEALRLARLHAAQPSGETAVPNPLGRSVMLRYLEAWLLFQLGRAQESSELLSGLSSLSPDYFFPSRVAECLILSWAFRRQPTDPVAGFGLGNLLYDFRRHDEAIQTWREPTQAGTAHATTHRNLGIALWNRQRDGQAARACYAEALRLAPRDARLVYEADQLAKRLNAPLQQRLSFLEAQRQLVLQRDDASVELATLLNLTGRPAEALDLLLSRRFHPWEGGEGAVLRQYTTARLALGCRAFEEGHASQALLHFTQAMQPPKNLGEAYHLLQAKADVNYYLGLTQRALGNETEARRLFESSAAESGDFSEMAVTAHSPLSYHRGLALRALRREDQAQALFKSLLAFAQSRLGQPAVIDYFATSLPNLLVFEEDLSARKDSENHLLAALAYTGLGELAQARVEVKQTLAYNQADQRAQDLLRQLGA